MAANETRRFGMDSFPLRHYCCTEAETSEEHAVVVGGVALVLVIPVPSTNVLVDTPLMMRMIHFDEDIQLEMYDRFLVLGVYTLMPHVLTLLWNFRLDDYWQSHFWRTESLSGNRH
jgi:hypothetical protein